MAPEEDEWLKYAYKPRQARIFDTDSSKTGDRAVVPVSTTDSVSSSRHVSDYLHTALTWIFS